MRLERSLDRHTKSIKQRLDKEGLSIPFPQRDVHMHTAEA